MITISLKGKNVKFSQAMRTYVEKKVYRLEKLLPDNFIGDLKVNVKILNKSEQEVTLNLILNNNSNISKSTIEADFYAGFDIALDKVERALRKDIDKMKTKRNKVIRKEETIYPKDINKILIELEKTSFIESGLDDDIDEMISQNEERFYQKYEDLSKDEREFWDKMMDIK